MTNLDPVFAAFILGVVVGSIALTVTILVKIYYDVNY